MTKNGEQYDNDRISPEWFLGIVAWYFAVSQIVNGVIILLIPSCTFLSILAKVAPSNLRLCFPRISVMHFDHEIIILSWTSCQTFVGRHICSRCLPFGGCRLYSELYCWLLLSSLFTLASTWGKNLCNTLKHLQLLVFQTVTGPLCVPVRTAVPVIKCYRCNVVKVFESLAPLLMLLSVVICVRNCRFRHQTLTCKIW